MPNNAQPAAFLPRSQQRYLYLQRRPICFSTTSRHPSNTQQGILPSACLLQVTLSLLAKDVLWNYLKFFGTHSPPHRAASSSESVRVLLHLELSLQAFKITKRSKLLRARRLVRRSRLASTTTSRSQLGVASASLRRSAVGGRQGCKKGSAHPCGGKSSSAPEVFAGATLFPR
jgi:hypothetical protein